jgi:hypothetical protein
MMVKALAQLYGDFTFSTSEKATPLLWINGKTIYVKCYSGSSVAANTVKNVGFPTGIDEVIDFNVMIDFAGNNNLTNNLYASVGALPNPGGTGWSSVWTESDGLKFKGVSSITSWKATLFYTKTS